MLFFEKIGGRGGLFLIKFVHLSALTSETDRAPPTSMTKRMENSLYVQMMAQADPQQVAGLMRFFKCGKGEYGEGDRFLGIKVPVTRSVVKACWQHTRFDELERCVTSVYHEIRLAALLTLIEVFRHAKRDREKRQRCVDFYLAHMDYINNWDLVDLSCYKLLGEWLVDQDRSLLYELAANGSTLWRQRIGMVSTMQFVRKGQLDDTFAIARLFLDKPRPLHDLLQKAVGWLLREAGKKDEERLRLWLDEWAPMMPRTMLRYAIERLPDDDRSHYLAVPKAMISEPIVAFRPPKCRK